jgi:hypothetical protein
VIGTPRAPPWFGNSHLNAAALLSEFRCLIAVSNGALNELSFDRDEVTGERGMSNVVGGDEIACSASGTLDITWWPAEMSSGADLRAQVSPLAGSTVVGGEVNGVSLEASAEAPA